MESNFENNLKRFKMGGEIMSNNENIKKNFMQLGLKRINPLAYLMTLLEDVYWISIDCYERIIEAHDDDNVGSGKRKTLPCKMECEEKIVDIASGELINTDEENIIAIFHTWFQYKVFRDKIRNIVMELEEIDRIVREVTGRTSN